MSDGEDEIETTHATAEESTSVGTVDRATMLKAQRKTLQGRITRTIKTVKKFINDWDQTKRRLEKEIQELRKDFNLTCEIHAELYNFAESSQVPRLDEWENELMNDVSASKKKSRRISSHCKVCMEPHRVKNKHLLSKKRSIACKPCLQDIMMDNKRLFRNKGLLQQPTKIITWKRMKHHCLQAIPVLEITHLLKMGAFSRQLDRLLPTQVPRCKIP